MDIFLLLNLKNYLYILDANMHRICGSTIMFLAKGLKYPMLLLKMKKVSTD